MTRIVGSRLPNEHVVIMASTVCVQCQLNGSKRVVFSLQQQLVVTVAAVW